MVKIGQKIACVLSNNFMTGYNGTIHWCEGKNGCIEKQLFIYFLHKDGLLYRLKSLIVFDMLNYFLLTALALNTGLQSQ